MYFTRKYARMFHIMQISIISKHMKYFRRETGLSRKEYDGKRQAQEV